MYILTNLSLYHLRAYWYKAHDNQEAQKKTEWTSADTGQEKKDHILYLQPTITLFKAWEFVRGWFCVCE